MDEDEDSDVFLNDSDDLIEDFDEDLDFNVLAQDDLADICSTYVNFTDLNIKSLLEFESQPIVSLTEEEREVIDNCTDHKLTRLLILNRAHASQVRELLKHLQGLLSLCVKNITKGTNVRSMSGVQNPFNIIADIWKTAAPYFKDARFFPAPENADVVKKQVNNQLCLLELNEGMRWTNSDKGQLTKHIKLHYFKYLYNDAKKELAIQKSLLKHKVGEEKVKIVKEIDHLNEKLSTLSPSFPPLKTVVGINWFFISTIALKGRHPIIECMAFWNMVLHPDINKDKWSPIEETNLREVVKHNKNRDWEKIVSDLGTNRSPFTVAQHYYRYLETKFNKERFTPEEDKYLIEVVKNVRIGSYIPWEQVAYYFTERSKYQLYHRYRYYLCYDNKKKGPFTVAEDALIIFLVRKYGRNFNKVATYIPNRAPIQIRNRYGSYLSKAFLQVGQYSYEEDLKIIEHVEKCGETDWSGLGRLLHRTRAHVRQRYYTLKKWRKNNKHKKLIDMPRRRRNSIVNTYSYRAKTINQVLDQLYACGFIPELEAVERLTSKKKENLRINKTITKLSSTTVDRELMEFFNSIFKIFKKRSFNDEMQTIASERVIKFMQVFDKDVSCLRNIQQEDDFLNWEMVPYIKDILVSQDITSASSEVNPIKYFLPPTIRTALGFRGLIIKLSAYRYDLKVAKVPHSSISEFLSLQVQQSLLKWSPTDRLLIEHDRNIFKNILFQVFKWPLILSHQYTSHIQFTDFISNANTNVQKSDTRIINDVDEQSTSFSVSPMCTNIPQGDVTLNSEIPNIQRKKVGRPHKKHCARVLKMKEGRLIKLNQNKQPAYNSNHMIETQPKLSNIPEIKLLRNTSSAITDPISTNVRKRKKYVVVKVMFKPNTSSSVEPKRIDDEQNEKIDSQTVGMSVSPNPMNLPNRADKYYDEAKHELNENASDNLYDASDTEILADLAMYSDIEVSSEIDAKVMEDVEALNSMKPQYPSCSIADRQNYMNL